MSYKLEMTAESRIVNMRSTAEIREIALLITCNGSVFEVRDEINLIFVIAEHLESLFLGNLFADNLVAFLGKFLHFFLYCRNIFIPDNIITKIHIIIEAFRNYRTYPELGMRIKMSDCLCHKMCT